MPPDLPHHHLDGPPPFFHLLGGISMFFLTLLLLAGLFFYLRRTGRISPPPWIAASHAPEVEAKKILAERFARGDISTDDFMERASVLNWTPGAQVPENWPPKKKRR